MQTNQAKKIVWSISGSDCSGLAGQAADTRVVERLGAHACSITTAVTAQNSKEVVAVQPLSGEQISKQILALKDELSADAIKIGLLPNKEVISEVKEYLKSYSGAVVLDPVIIASSGKRLMDEVALKEFETLYPLITLITPNVPELELLAKIKIHSQQDMVVAAKKLRANGVHSVLVKGGHINNQSDYVCDYFIGAKESFWLTSRSLSNDNTRGTGCALATAIATALAKKHSLEDAVVIGKMLINQAIRNGYKIGRSKGPISPKHWPNEQQDMPLLTKLPLTKKKQQYQFPSCHEKPVGLYPVVDSAAWVKRLVALGITTIQLRVKDFATKQLEQEIIDAIQIANKYKARLFINDYWKLAIKHKAYGIHLGQEDLDTADLKAINDAGLRLGISTHCYYEVARAHAIKPSYMACGPIYPTDSKDMPWTPHGIENLKYWVNTMNEYPWVAIGGINLERFANVARTKVSGVAMISAITAAQKPEIVVKEMMSILNNQELIERRLVE